MPEQRPLRSAQQANYTLRSVFIYRRLKHVLALGLQDQIVTLDISGLDWQLEDLGISLTAMEKAKAAGLKPHLVFCHPEVIAANPRLVLYYRCLSAISQKGITKLLGSVVPYESGTRTSIPPERALLLARTLNCLISAILDSEPTPAFTVLLALFPAAYTVELDGSWRGQIGQRIGRQVKELLVTDLLERGHISHPLLSLPELLTKNVFTLDNGYRLAFGSEPDVAIYDPDDILACAIEVKGGMDEAGALERYGATKKSFDTALARNPRVLTVYLASCITPTVRQRINADRMVREAFDLAEVLLDPTSREHFLSQFYWWLHLSR